MAKPKPKKKESKKKNPAKNKAVSLSTIEFGKKVGVTKQRILKAIEDGVLSTSVSKSKHGDGFRYSIDEEKGLKEWADNIDPTKQRDPEKAAETKELSKKGEGSASNYQKAKAMKEFYNAKLAELEFQEKAGKLVSSARVKAESFKIGRRVRDSIMGVPERVAAEVAAMDEPRLISIYLKEQLAAALKDLEDLNNVGSPRA